MPSAPAMRSVRSASTSARFCSMRARTWATSTLPSSNENAAAMWSCSGGLMLRQNVVAWLAEPRLAMWCVIAVAVWTGTPFYTMSFLAGLQAIPKELYEAARLDGASALQEFRYVTVPGMQAIFLVTVMLSTVFTSTSLVVVNILTNGAPAERTNILPNFSYNLAMGTGRLGIASAVNMIFFPLLILVIVGISRRLLAARAA